MRNDAMAALRMVLASHEIYEEEIRRLKREPFLDKREENPEEQPEKRVELARRTRHLPWNSGSTVPSASGEGRTPPRGGVASSGINPAGPMSRAFVKEDALADNVLDRPISPHPNYVTASGLAQIEAALETARQAHAAAQRSGDRAQLAKASSELRYWSARRGNAQVVKAGPSRTAVQFGSIVTIERDKRKQTSQIVGEDEADPPNGKISYVSPLARAVMNRHVGDAAMARGSEIEIIAVHPAKSS